MRLKCTCSPKCRSISNILLFQDQYTYNSLNVLYEYLSDSAISPLERDFIQIEEPYCSNVCMITTVNVYIMQTPKIYYVNNLMYYTANFSAVKMTISYEKL